MPKEEGIPSLRRHPVSDHDDRFDGFHVRPPSRVLKRPWGDAPPYHSPASDSCPGVSQKTWLTVRSDSPSFGESNAGGRLASFHDLPPSSVANTPAAEMPIHSLSGSDGSETMVCSTRPAPPGFQLSAEG